MSVHYHTTLTLLKRAKDQNDSRAWEELIDFYQDYIYSVFKSLNVNDADADNLLKQVTLKMQDKLPSFEYKEGRDRFMQWVIGIVKDEVGTFVDKQKTHARTQSSAKHHAAFAYLNSIKLTEADKIAENEWMVFITNKAFALLEKQFTPHAITAFKKHSSGVSIKDISLDMGSSIDTVSKYVSRIKVFLVEKIDELKKELDC